TPQRAPCPRILAEGHRTFAPPTTSSISADRSLSGHTRLRDRASQLPIQDMIGLLGVLCQPDDRPGTGVRTLVGERSDFQHIDRPLRYLGQVLVGSRAKICIADLRRWHRAFRPILAFSALQPTRQNPRHFFGRKGRAQHGFWRSHWIDLLSGGEYRDQRSKPSRNIGWHPKYAF